MVNGTEIRLTITPESLKQFCQEVAIGSANTNRKHAAFMALEAFISRYAGADAHTTAYRAVQQVVEEYSAETRAQLLVENANSLTSALAKQQLARIAEIFSSVSRNGFRQILLQTFAEMSEEQLDETRQWVTSWCASAKGQAEQASGYPDALDFRRIDIELIEYTALSEIKTVLMGFWHNLHNENPGL